MEKKLTTTYSTILRLSCKINQAQSCWTQLGLCPKNTRRHKPGSTFDCIKCVKVYQWKVWLSWDRFEFRSSENTAVIAVTPSLSLERSDACYNCVMNTSSLQYKALIQRFTLSVNQALSVLFTVTESCRITSHTACVNVWELTLVNKHHAFGWENKTILVFYILWFNINISSLMLFTFLHLTSMFIAMAKAPNSLSLVKYLHILHLLARGTCDKHLF